MVSLVCSAVLFGFIHLKQIIGVFRLIRWVKYTIVVAIWYILFFVLKDLKTSW